MIFAIFMLFVPKEREQEFRDSTKSVNVALPYKVPCFHKKFQLMGVCLNPTFIVFTRSVDVSVRRVGGAYGSKLTRSNSTAAACALGAQATRRYVEFPSR